MTEVTLLTGGGGQVQSLPSPPKFLQLSWNYGPIAIRWGKLEPEEGDVTEPQKGEDEQPDDDDEDVHNAHEESGKPISDSLASDLSAHRTLGLCVALADQPETALIALTHTLTAQLFYSYLEAGCLKVRPWGAVRTGSRTRHGCAGERAARGLGQTVAARRGGPVGLHRRAGLGEADRVAILSRGVMAGTKASSRIVKDPMSPKLQLYLIRHGETQWNATGKYQGRFDSPLTERGIRQAQGCGKALAGCAEHVNHWYVSPLGRAQQTSAIVRSFGMYPPAQSTSLLSEVSAGSWDGLTQTDIDAQWPGLLDGSTQFDWYFRAPDGERYDDALDRVGKWLDQLSGVVVAVSHGLLGRLIRGTYLGLTKGETLSLPVPQDVIWQMENGRIEAIDGR